MLLARISAMTPGTFYEMRKLRGKWHDARCAVRKHHMWRQKTARTIRFPVNVTMANTAPTVMIATIRDSFPYGNSEPFPAAAAANAWELLAFSADDSTWKTAVFSLWKYAKIVASVEHSASLRSSCFAFIGDKSTAQASCDKMPDPSGCWLRARRCWKRSQRFLMFWARKRFLARNPVTD